MTDEAMSADPPWWEEECFRASGNAICPVCGLVYRKHPQVAKEECPTLVRSCSGELLKL